MKVLSVRQPWAWALLQGGKDIENRNWSTNHRGPLAIHAGKKFDLSKSDIEAWVECERGGYGDGFTRMLRDFEQEPDNDVRGAIIGIVDLVDCIPSHACDSTWKAGPDPDYFCWKVANPRVLEVPILMKGQLGLFTVPDELFGEFL